MIEVTRFVDQCVERNGRLLISVLEDIQKQYRYLPEDALRAVARKTGIPLRDVYGVATFYNAFSLIPKGEHVMTVCLGTACHVRGGSRIADTLADELGIAPGETSANGKFSLETVNCLGCCAIGPIVLLDGVYFGEVTPQKALKLLKKAATEKKDVKVAIGGRAGRTAEKAGKTN